MQPVIERYAPRFAVLSGVSLLIVLTAWLGIALRTLERMQHPNLLSHCQESYLQACQYQLVNWRSWDAQAVERAQKLDRPLLVEVGAFWSGRCRRLGWELFQDSGVADLINREFVPIKIDGDASPKRARYILQLVSLLNLPERYPAIALFTPDGKPITAITPETRAELMRALERISSSYQSAPELVFQQADGLERQWSAQRVRPAQRVPLGEVALVDPTPIWSDVPTWRGDGRYWLNYCEWLLARAEMGDAQARAQLFQHLTALRQSPLWDSEKGGYYAIAEGLDAENKPKGGKRLIEHARLLSLYARASRWEPELAPHAIELLQVMRSLFWQERPAGFIASVAPPPSLSPVFREPSPRKRDSTLIADGNALAVIALVDYLESLPPSAPNREWARNAALRTMETLRALRAPNGALFRTSRRQSSDWLPDLALVALTGCRVQRIAPSERNLLFVLRLAERIEQDYRDPTGGYYDTALGKRWGGWVIPPVRVSADEELPADNALVALLQMELGELTGERIWLERAQETLEVMAGDLDPQRPWLYAGFWRALTRYQKVREQ